MNSLLIRKTIRKYKSELISSDLLSDLFIEGCRASTTGNMQLYSIINTSSVEIKQQLAPLHFNQKMITEAPNVLTFCADFNRFKLWCAQSDAEPGFDNFLSFMNAAIDALLVAQTVAIAAEYRGLGICYLGTTIYNAEKIIEVLKLPKGVIPITTLTIGWPAENPEQTDRLPLDGLVHNDIYKDYTSEDITSIYSTKEALDVSIKFTQENQKQTLAQVFTDVRYKKADNEFFSEKLLEVIRNQGFNFPPSNVSV